jgi:hypothetical protein
MARWTDFEAAETHLAARVRTVFDSGRHKTMATVRCNGSPRISGIEARFEDGELIIGMMAGSRKAVDVARDGRVALHSPSFDPPEDPSSWAGDAKISGHAVLCADREGEEPGTRYRVDIGEVSLVRVGTPADHLVVESWSEAGGYQRRERR